MPSRLSTFLARLLPNGPLDFVRQVVLCVTAFQLYRLTRGLVDNPEAATTAFSNARELIHAEQALNIFVEPSLQAFAAGQQWLYAVFPTAPPRFFPEWGFFDAVSDFTGVPQDSVTINELFNPYAAVAAGIGALAARTMARARPLVWMFDPAHSQVQPAQAMAAP